MSDESGVTPPAPAPAPTAAGGADAPNAKMIALLGWIFAPFGIIALFMDEYKDNMWVRQHVIQGAAVYVVQFVLWWVALGWIVLIYQIVMALKANKGESVEVPVVYGIVKNMIENK